MTETKVCECGHEAADHVSDGCNARISPTGLLCPCFKIFDGTHSKNLCTGDPDTCLCDCAKCETGNCGK